MKLWIEFKTRLAHDWQEFLDETELTFRKIKEALKS